MKVNCVACSIKNLDKDTVGLNKKFLGTTVKNFYCMDCLAEHLCCTVQDLHDKIKEFKEDGCAFFK
jgi:hypothetical protein